MTVSLPVDIPSNLECISRRDGGPRYAQFNSESVHFDNEDLAVAVGNSFYQHVIPGTNVTDKQFHSDAV